jgi:hypothetical protein
MARDCDACGKNQPRHPRGGSYERGWMQCDACSGTGEVWSGKSRTWIDDNVEVQVDSIMVPCGRCGGSGSIRCTKCHGTGELD